MSDTEAEAAAHKKGRDGDAVSLPFEASLYTDLVSLLPDDKCGSPPRFLNTQAGEGEATHLGRFSIVLSFCADASDFLDGELSEGESIPYDTGEGVLTAANGDELWMEIDAGAVVPSDHPDFAFEFMDPFEFTGGTGKFENATGGGMIDSKVDFYADPSRTYHSWSGTLDLRRPNE